MANSIGYLKRDRKEGDKQPENLQFLFHYPFIRHHLDDLELSFVMLSFHILTESRGTKLEVRNVLGEEFLGLAIVAHSNRNGPFSKALNTAIIDLKTL